MTLDKESIHIKAVLTGKRDNDICCVCLKAITVMSFRGTGVCSENHRKERDNDHKPADGIIR